MGQSPKTSWQGVSRWYKESVGLSGHFYHQTVILPKSLKLLNLAKGNSLLDLACGNGILGRQVGQIEYLGIDASDSLIKFAKKNDHQSNHNYLVADITKPLPVKKHDFSHATIILALQNLENPQKAIINAANHLRPGGKLLLVINHPCFRIPRQTSWGIDETKKLQYRRVDRYLTPMKIPILAHPGKGNSGQTTLSFHYSLQDIFRPLNDASFAITHLEEWTSGKESQGKAAKMENRGRAEFPLFLALLSQKL